MKFLFWKKSKDLPALENNSKHTLNVDKNLRDLFKTASHGDYFRTRTMVSSHHDSHKHIWRSAIRLPYNEKWRVIEHKEVPNIENIGSKAGTLIQKNQIIANELSFFDALENLVIFEIGNPDLGYHPVENDELKKLGNTHYIPFAEKEGIAFDTSGLPHPTVKGKIVTEGDFTLKSLRNASAYKESPSEPYKLWEDNLITRMLEENVTTDHYFEKIVKSLQSKSKIQEIIQKLNTLQKFQDILFSFPTGRQNILTIDGSNYDPLYNYSYNRSLPSQSGQDSFIHKCLGGRKYSSRVRSQHKRGMLPHEYVNTTLNDCKQLVTQAFESDALAIKNICNALESINLSYEILEIKYNFLRAYKGLDKKDDDFNSLLKRVKMAQQKYMQLNSNHNDKSVSSFILSNIQNIETHKQGGSHIDVPKFSLYLAQSLDKIIQNLDKNINSYTQTPSPPTL